ncbi:hypothetical protein TRVA0_080S00210 [Trichomonascus vanleenenianus]|uniref:glycoside hydrolase family 47 protein n=1 Tax=Trichomonascus vanleenenianus TaxID=2268995 RepID=UPI003EC97590
MLTAIYYKARRHRLYITLAVFLVVILVQFTTHETIQARTLGVDAELLNSFALRADDARPATPGELPPFAREEDKVFSEAIVREGKALPPKLPHVAKLDEGRGKLDELDEKGKLRLPKLNQADMSPGRPRRPERADPLMRLKGLLGGLDFTQYEILTRGDGAARTNRKSTTRLPSAIVPRKDKFPAGDTIRVPPPKMRLSPVQSNIVESDVAKTTRRTRREAVRRAMQISWQQYRHYAWGYDEIKPVSQTGSNPFLAWAATIVDSLDTLKIMGLEAEYREALNYIAQIDFTSTFRKDIPLFETVIRYLGGLLAAYDLSEGKDAILLTKAKELADNLIGAFDTPNRMPMTFYQWTDKDTRLKYRAGTDSGFSEVATLALEFTRLAQLSGNDTYYDAVARITNAMYDYAPKSTLPWLFSTTADLSGCKIDNSELIDPPSLVTETDLKESRLQPFAADSGSTEAGRKLAEKIMDNSELLKRSVEASPENVALQNMVKERPKVRESPSSDDSSDDKTPVLVPTGRGNFMQGWCHPSAAFRKGAHAWPESFTMGSLVDSAYEYYMKMYQLLGAGEPKYEELYVNMVEAAKIHLIFKPKVPNNDGILFAGTKAIRSDGSADETYEMTHLTCFAGGMFALAGRLLNRPQDVDLGARLTQGCVWAYNSTRSGVMPESFLVDKCPGNDWDAPCKFDLEEALHGTHENPNRVDVIGSPNGKYTRPIVERVRDEEGNMRWPVFGVYDQPYEFYRMDARYLLRPEAIESVFYMHRITGDENWLNHGWRMFQSVTKLTQILGGEDNNTVVGYSAVSDVTDNNGPGKTEDPKHPYYLDSAESFWMGETLKYFYLLFDEDDHISLDDYVFNTEAHPFKVPKL